MYLPDYILNVISVLESGGFEAYCVGGCVRDYLLGRCPDDYDICTSALPEQIIKIFDGYHLLTVGLKHGTVTVIVDGNPVEITTYRIDGNYIDHRHPDKVDFTDSLAEDLSRRDFTVNAMAYNPKTGIVDLFGGKQDLEKKLIRAVGNPETRFDEDGLRIFRALRFASKYGFKIEENTASAVHKLAHLLNGISAERVQTELNGFLIGRCGPLLREFSDVICTVIPELKPSVGFKQNSKYHDKTVYDHIATTVESAEPKLIYRLTMLLHDIGKPESYTEVDGVGHFYGHAAVSKTKATEILSRLKYSRKITDEVLFLIEHHGIVMNNTVKYIRKAVAKYGEQRFFDLLRIHIFDNCGKAPDYIYECDLFTDIAVTARDYLKDGVCLDLKSLAVNGRDITAVGITGADIGKALNLLLSAVVDEECENNKQSLLSYLEKTAYFGSIMKGQDNGSN